LKTVLVIEDDIAVLEALQVALEFYGYPVAVARNGREALARLDAEENLPGLIFLDLMMPVMDGFEFLEERSKRPKIAKIPVVVMSARTSFKELFRDSTVSKCINKPVDLETLAATAKMFCSPPPSDPV